MKISYFFFVKDSWCRYVFWNRELIKIFDDMNEFCEIPSNTWVLNSIVKWWNISFYYDSFFAVKNVYRLIFIMSIVFFEKLLDILVILNWRHESLLLSRSFIAYLFVVFLIFISRKWISLAIRHNTKILPLRGRIKKLYIFISLTIWVNNGHTPYIQISRKIDTVIIQFSQIVRVFMKNYPIYSCFVNNSK